MLALGEMAPEELTPFCLEFFDELRGTMVSADFWASKRDGSLWVRRIDDPTMIELVTIPMPAPMREMFRRLAQGRKDWSEPIDDLDPLELFRGL